MTRRSEGRAGPERSYGKRLYFKDYVFVEKTATDAEIIRYAKKHDDDRHGVELDRIEHGSTVANVSKYAHCHVIAIRNPAKRFTLPGQMY
jgi:hypothetical protein